MPFSQEEIDTTAQRIREALQMAGISARGMGWDDLAEDRKYPHRKAAEFLLNRGFRLVGPLVPKNAEKNKMKDGELYNKYVVTLRDGEKVDPSHRFFVLSIDTDPCAIIALLAYAEACNEDRPILSKSIMEEYIQPHVEASK